MTAKDIALSELHTLKEIIKDVKDIELKALMKKLMQQNVFLLAELGEVYFR